MTKMRNEYEDYSPFFVKPHTLISLLLLICMIYVLATTSLLIDQEAAAQSDPRDIVPSPLVLRSMAIVALMFMGLGAIHLPNTIMTRPISFLWRLLLALFILYICFVVFIMTLPISHARLFFTAFDPSLGEPLPEKLYAEDCRVFTPENPHSYFANVKDCINDCHFAAHFVGWWVKMLIFRDWYISWTISLLFELCELTFKYWLPNFSECWWDSLLLDVFGCNLIGLVLGRYTLKYFGVTKIKWIRSQSTPVKRDVCSTDKLKSAIEKMTPEVFEVYEWSYL